MFVKPAESRAVRWPSSKRLLKQSGETVPDTMFWQRLLANGDVQNVEPEPSAPDLPEPHNETSLA
ncbi:DUF2635 domain-containing protein [Acetobacter cibinongensis]|uniref:DUF2635 domain-containing protein n=1 Tax=Acetobacter cibinongensis TaxID=146475 RepID=UPI000A3AE079|nr:DUF2635 domain-containing protein [Acetobacter cibinongensis]